MDLFNINIIFLFTFLIILFIIRGSGLSKLLVGIWLFSTFCGITYTNFYLLGYADISLDSVIFLDTCILIYILPLVKFKKGKTICISDKTTRRIELLLIFIGILSILPFIEHSIYFAKTFSAQSSSIVDTYHDKMQVGHKETVTWLDPISLQLNYTLGRLTSVNIFLLFILFIKKRHISIPKLILYSIVVLTPVLNNLNQSGRVSFAFFIISISLLFLLFKGFIKIKLQKKFYITLLAFTAVVIGAIVTITFMRSDSLNQYDTWTWTTLYFGEGQVNFCNWMWDIREYTQGDNSFSFFKNCVGLDTYIDQLMRRKVWNESRIGIDPVRFYTFLGDWFSDIGPIFTLLLVITLSFLVYKFLKRKYWGIIGLYLVYQYAYIFATGFTFYAYKSFYGTYSLVFGLIVLLLINYGSASKIKNILSSKKPGQIITQKAKKQL